MQWKNGENAAPVRKASFMMRSTSPVMFPHVMASGQDMYFALFPVGMPMSRGQDTETLMPSRSVLRKEMRRQKEELFPPNPYPRRRGPQTTRPRLQSLERF